MNRFTEPTSDLPRQDESLRPAPPVRDGSFSGRLKALSISDVLEFLRVLSRRGVLVLKDSEREVCLQVRDGRIAAATSNEEDGDLAGFLLRQGKLSKEQRETVLERERNGERTARVLIEAGILTPKSLWDALRRQAQRIVGDVFEWDAGEFQFREGAEIPGAGMDLGLPILELVGEGIRSVRNTALFSERMPSEGSVFEAITLAEGAGALPLEPHERYVLSLIDGQRSLAEVVRTSEIGRAETLRVVFLLFSSGYLKMRAFQAEERTSDDRTLPLVRSYNEMFAYLYRYLVKEVGPIGEAILSRYLLDQIRQRPDLLTSQKLGRDGTLDERLIAKSARGGRGASAEEGLVDGLNELLYAELLAIRRTLGPQHEGRAVQGLRELGLQPITAPEAPMDAPRKA
jgi:hypothetical protein